MALGQGIGMGLPSWQRTGVVLAAGVGLVSTGALVSPANAGYDQEGRTAGNHSVDGSYSRLQGNGFSANNHQCVIYSAISEDFTSNGTPHRQLESGLVRCNNATIDGTCHNGYVFVERYDGSYYHCKQGYSFSNKYQYDATTYRKSPTSTTFHGHVNGASLDQGGFNLSYTTVARTWGEASGGSTCPAPSRGTFHIWKKYDTSGGWTYVTGSSRYRNHSGIPAAPCWATISATNSSGGYDVD